MRMRELLRKKWSKRDKEREREDGEAEIEGGGVSFHGGVDF